MNKNNVLAKQANGNGTLSILISTINDGIRRVPQVLLPPRKDVQWVVAWQRTENHDATRGEEEPLPDMLAKRGDVKVVVMEGRGLSRSRNNAMAHADGDILLLADDDNRYSGDMIDGILQTYDEHREADIICFEAEDYEGRKMKRYPNRVMTYEEACRHGYYLSSVEMTMRRGVAVEFNTNFGLGSGRWVAGEEDVWMKDARDGGYRALFVPRVVVQTDPCTTGLRAIDNPQLLRSKGATFRYVYGLSSALWRSLKEGGWWLVHKGVNPVPIIYNMVKGVLALHRS